MNNRNRGDISKRLTIMILIAGLTVSQTLAQPFTIPQIDPDKVKEELDKVDTESIEIPIKNKDGLYDLVEIVYEENGGTQTITIPNYGDITIITDEDGNLDLNITPEDVKGSDNMSCSVSPLSKKTSCSVEPLFVIEDGTVYSADKAQFAYQEGKDVSKLDITSNNLLITNKDEKTEITKSETNLGNANISLQVTGENKDDFLLGVIPGIDKGDRDPKNLDSIAVSASSSTLVHSVTNPNNPNDKKEKLNIPGGINTTIRASHDAQGNLSLYSSGSMNGSVKYDSDPFSDNKITATSNSSAGFELTFTEAGKNSQGTLVLSTPEQNSKGEQSQLQIVDTTDSGIKNTVTSSGATSIIINQSVDNPGDKRELGDTEFAIASGALDVMNEEGGNTKKISLTNTQLVGSGNTQTKQGSATLSADSLRITDDNKKKGYDLNLFGNVTAMGVANEKESIASIDADNVVFSNKDIAVDANGDVNVTFKSNKDSSQKIGDKVVKQEIFAKADNISVEDDKTKGSLTGGTYYQATFEDGSSFHVANAQSGAVSSDQSKVNFSDGAQFVTTYNKDGKIQSTQVSSSKLEGTHKDKTKFSVQDSSTTVYQTKDKDGTDLTQVLHSSSQLNANDEKNDAKVKGLNINASYTDKVKYATVDFDKFEGISKSDKDLETKVTINDGKVVFYEDEEQTQATASAKELAIDQKDIALNITAIGEDGKKGNFTIYYIEKDGETLVQVYGEDGEKVKLTGSDKDKNFGDILFKTAQYYKNDEITTFVVNEAQGNIKSIDNNDEILGDFKAAQVSAYMENDKSFSQYTFSDGQLNLEDKQEGITAGLSAKTGVFQEENKDGVTTLSGNFTDGIITANDADLSSIIKFDNLNFYQDNEQTVGSISSGSDLRLSSNKKGEAFNATLIGFDAYGIEKDSIKYGEVNFDKFTIEESPSNPSQVGQRVQLVDGSVMFYESTEDDKLIREAKLSTSAIEATDKDFRINITAIGEDGSPGKFTMFYLQEGNEKSVRIYDEEGKLVKLSGEDKDKNFGDILFKTAQYYENEELKQFMVEDVKVSGNIAEFETGKENVVLDFNAARLGGVQLNDGSFKKVTADNIFLSQKDPNSNTVIDGSIESGSFTQTNYLGTISNNIQAYNSTINYNEYKDGKLSGDQKLSSTISFGSLVASSVENPDGKKLSLLKVKDLDFLATDYDNMVKASGKVGELSTLSSDELQVVDIKDLENLKLESLDQDIDALFNGKQFLKIDSKDSSYLLVKDANGVINAKDDKMTAKVNFNARVFEFVRDEVTGRNVILKADADFNATAKMKTPIGGVKAKVEGAIKGENIWTSSSSFKSEDGKRQGGEINIHADKLEKLHFKTKVGFIDLLELDASGKNGQSIKYSYEIDKSQGVIKLKGVYKKGDKLETKFLFFKLKSHKEGEDAVSALKIKLKGQSIQDHMAILSETASVRKINDFFGVSDGGAITFTAGAKDKGFAMELMMVDERFAFRAPNSFKTFHKPTNSYGVAIKYIQEDNTTWGVQTALTSDSRIEFEGDLHAFGTKVESLPTTANLNLTYTNADDDLSVVGGVHMPLTTSLVDEDLLDPDAQFFDGGSRKANGPGAHLAVTKKFDNSELRFAGGLYDDFKEPAFHLTYQGSPQALANLGRGIINIASGEPFEKGFKKDRRPSSYQRQKARQKMIKDREIEEMEAKRMTVLEKKIDELQKYYADKPGFKKIKEILKIAKDYLNGPVDYSDTRKDIFSYRVEDRAEFAYYEKDKEKIDAIDSIVLGIIENKIITHDFLNDKVKESMLETYRQRRYYESLKSFDQLALMNETGLNPCEFYLQNHADE
jgi:hypothetical protein